VCGVFGFAGTAPDPARLEFVAGLSARRGPQASGFAWTVSGGLLANRASVSWAKAKAALAPSLRDARAIVGHFRLATSGGWKDGGSNQPLVVGETAVVHNGNVDGWREIAAAEGIALATECDSEVIAHWVERACGSLVERLETACCRLSTPFVVLALRQGEVCVARRGLPLFAWNAPEGVYYGSVAGEGSVAVPERIRVVE